MIKTKKRLKQECQKGKPETRWHQKRNQTQIVNPKQQKIQDTNSNITHTDTHTVRFVKGECHGFSRLHSHTLLSLLWTLVLLI